MLQRHRQSRIIQVLAKDIEEDSLPTADNITCITCGAIRKIDVFIAILKRSYPLYLLINNRRFVFRLIE